MQSMVRYCITPHGDYRVFGNAYAPVVIREYCKDMAVLPGSTLPPACHDKQPSVEEPFN